MSVALERLRGRGLKFASGDDTGNAAGNSGRAASNIVNIGNTAGIAINIALRARGGEGLAPAAPAPAGWSFAALAGRLVELSGDRAAAGLTLACALLREAQRAGEPTAWIMVNGSGFYPPDAAANGVQLAALAVLRVPDMRAVSRAAERLVRSGAFGLLVLDLGARARIPPALQGRLVQQAQRHRTAVLCLTEKPERFASLGSLVSLRAGAVRRRRGDDRFACVLTVCKDKRRGPGWSHEEEWHGPPGLR